MKGQRHALLIGVNRSRAAKRSAPAVAGCTNDVLRLYPLLAERGFRIRLLLEQRATRAGIVAAIDRLAAAVAPGDEVVLYYSGPGSRVRAPEWPRGFQTLVPDDSRRGNPGANRDVFDVEINRWIDRLAAGSRRLTLIFDTCCSFGDGARAVAADRRPETEMLADDYEPAELPAAVRDALAAGGEEARGASGWRSPGGRRAILIAAAGAGGKALEIVRDGLPHGCFSDLLAAEIEAPGNRQTPWGELDWRRILAAVGAEMAGVAPDLEPILEGWEPPETNRRAAATEEESPAAPAPVIGQHALLIGVNRYPNIAKTFGRPLAGCINDVLQLHALFAERGFRIRLLLDGYATRERIVAAMNRLIAEVGPGDVVVLHYSGHGAQVKARGWQRTFQTIVPHDSGRGKRDGKPLPNRDIFDTEIDLWIKRLNERTERVTLLFDSCHSGGVSRHGQGGVRSLSERDEREPDAMFGAGEEAPAAVRQALAAAAGNRGDATPGASGWLGSGDRRAIVFAACGAGQWATETTQETPEGSVSYGTFSYHLTRALAERAATPWQELDWRAIRDAVVSDDFRSSSPGQQPAIDGLDEAAAAGELRRLAVVIGVGRCDALPDLETPEADAELVAAELENRQGYEVHRLLGPEATREGIRSLLDELRKGSKIGRDSALLLYFAGHGVAEGDGAGGFQGYLQPRDADPEDRGSWLPMAEIHGKLLEEPRCRHLLLVLDCCFAGAYQFATRGVRRRRRLFKSQYQRYLESEAWQLLSSAAHDQLARDKGRRQLDGGDHSPFAAAFVSGLRGAADLIGDGLITVTELFEYVHSELLAVPGHQTPGLRHLSRESKGQYFFRHPERRFEPLDDPPLDDQRSPWRGLEPYLGGADEAPFYGRERVVDELAARLADAGPRVLAVVGASGSGKSSVVRAGLWPQLRSQNEWQIVELPRLGEDPGRQLEEALGGAQGAAPATGRRLLFSDQFEELYTRCPDEERRRSFLALLRRRLAAGERILVTLRSAFLPRLAAALGDALAVYRLPELELDELREVIERPAEEHACFLDPPLMSRMLEDVRSTSSPLPLLSVALSEMYRRAWRRWQASERPDRELSAADYAAVGGVAGVLRQRAEELFARLEPRRQEILRRLFLRLVSLDGGHRTRRRAELRELELADAGEGEVQEVLDAWIDSRFLVGDQEHVEPANTALLREWEKIDRWLDDGAELVPLLRQVWRAAVEWADRGREPGLLWDDDPRLDQLANRRAELNRLESDFLDASLGARRDELALARRQSRIRLARQLAAQSWVERDRQLDLALLLSLEADRILAAEGEELLEVTASLVGAAGRNPHLDRYLHGHSAAVTTVAWSPDGRQLASAGADGVILLWEAATGRQGTVLHPGGAEVLCVAWSGDGRTLAAGFGDGRIVLYDPAAGRPATRFARPVLEGHRDAVAAVAWSGDGRTLASASHDRTVVLWDVASGEARLPGLVIPAGRALAVAWSPDGRTLAGAGEDRRIFLWDAASGELRRTLAGGEDDAWSCLAWSPDGELLAAAGKALEVSLWDPARGEPAHPPLAGHMYMVSSLAWSGDGRILASASRDGKVIVRLRDQGFHWLAMLAGHRGWASAVSVTADGRALASGSSDGTVMLWHLMALPPLGTFLPGLGQQVWNVAWSGDGTTLAAAGTAGEIGLWDAAARRLRSRLRGHQGPVPGIAWSPGGETLASGGMDGTVLLWDPATGKIRRRLPRHRGGARAVAWSGDGRILAAATGSGTVVLRDAATGDAVEHLDLGDGESLICLAWSPDGEWLAAAGESRGILLWPMGEAARRAGGPLPRPARRLEGHRSRVWSLAWSPDGRLLASGGEDHTVRLWEAATARPAGEPLTGHDNKVSGVAWSPDGRFLATVADDWRLIVWQAVSGELLGEMSGKEQLPIFGNVAWSPDGRTIATSGHDDGIVLWDFDPDAWRRSARRRANRRLSRREWDRFLGPEIPYRSRDSERRPETVRSAATATAAAAARGPRPDPRRTR